DRDKTRVQCLRAVTNLDSETDVREGDLLILTTDAVAQWILEEYGSRHNQSQFTLMSRLVALAEAHMAFGAHAEQIGIHSGQSDPWNEFIQGLREQKAIVNDDSTLLIVRMDSLSDGRPPAA